MTEHAAGRLDLALLLAAVENAPPVAAADVLGTWLADALGASEGAGDASCLDGYMGRRATRFEHTAEIAVEYGYRDFAAAEKQLARWLDDRAWTTGEGPTGVRPT